MVGADLKVIWEMSAKVMGINFVKSIIYWALYKFIYISNAIFGNGLTFEFPFLSNAHPVVLFFKNLLRPARMYGKFRYGQLGFLSRIASKADPVPKDIMEAARHDDQYDEYLRRFKEDGILILDGYFKNVAEEMVESFDGSKMSNSAAYYYDTYVINSLEDQLAFQMVADPLILGVMAGYLNAHPYLRHHSSIQSSYPNREQQELERLYKNDMRESKRIFDRELKENPWSLGRELKEKMTALNKSRASGYKNCLWHCDTVNNITLGVLLKEATLSDTHMMFARRSHRNHHSQLLPLADYNYCEEYVQKTYEIINCVGSVGTFVAFDSNGLHRMNPKPGKLRMQFVWALGPGNTPHFKQLERGLFLTRKTDPTPPDLNEALQGQINFFRDFSERPQL